MKGRDIKSALREGRRVYSTAVVAASPLWPKAVAAAGADFVFIDSEHTPLDRKTLAWVCSGYSAVNVPPIVRIPSPDPYEAAKVLDGGASGFIAPYLETADQARELTALARYRPLKGARVAEAVQNADSLEPELRTYLEDRNADIVFIANIESVPAIENLGDILAVGGIDSVLIGPHDLSCSLGIPEQYDHPRFDEAVRTIFRIAREHSTGAGIHFWESIEREVEWSRSAGGNLIMHSADLRLFGDNLKRDLDVLRTTFGDRLDADQSGEDVV
jgi:2-keto-3-deoxy-L-rhamnonate aldolase RhmA